MLIVFVQVENQPTRLGSMLYFAALIGDAVVINATTTYGDSTKVTQSALCASAHERVFLWDHHHRHAWGDRVKIPRQSYEQLAGLDMFIGAIEEVATTFVETFVYGAISRQHSRVGFLRLGFAESSTYEDHKLVKILSRSVSSIVPVQLYEVRT
jgi:hypothetical protein